MLVATTESTRPRTVFEAPSSGRPSIKRAYPSRGKERRSPKRRRAITGTPFAMISNASSLRITKVCISWPAARLNLARTAAKRQAQRRPREVRQVSAKSILGSGRAMRICVDHSAMSAFGPLAEVDYHNHCGAQHPVRRGRGRVSFQRVAYEELVLISVKIARGFYAMFQCCLWCCHDDCSSYPGR